MYTKLTNSELMTKQLKLKQQLEQYTKDSFVNFTMDKFNDFREVLHELSNIKTELALRNALIKVEYNGKEIPVVELINIKMEFLESKTLLDNVIQSPNIANAVNSNSNVILQITNLLNEITTELTKIHKILNDINNRILDNDIKQIPHRN